MQRDKPTKGNSNSRVRRRSIADRQDAPRSEHPLPAWSPFASEIIQRLRYALTVSSGSSLYNRDVVLTVPDEDPAVRSADLPPAEADLPGYELGYEPGRGVCRGSSRRLSAPQCFPRCGSPPLSAPARPFGNVSRRAQ